MTDSASIADSQPPDPAAVSDARLEALRQLGDPDVDPLVEAVLTDSAGGRRGYNLMLDLADQVVAAPELLMTDSHLRRTLAVMPESLQEYFAPQRAPAWVDANKLAVGAGLWAENMLIALGVLYAASLPACYLIARGIPALYDTAKLLDSRYIFQRIYETGVMLDAVMRPGGIRVVQEASEPAELRLERSLQAADPDGRWRRVGNELRREGAAQGSLDKARVVAALDADPGVSRFLYGEGYVAARKVRFLHASMRHIMLKVTTTEATDEADASARMSDHLADKSWDSAALGVPINQEDLAFTLLTFGYLIPKGLRHWGVRMSDVERDAFLHTWKVVGYLMGIEEELLTDDWTQAEKLYARLRQRQAGHSQAGVALTNTLLGFLADYLPDHGQLGKRIGASMIVDQLGLKYAAMVLPAAQLSAARARPWRIAYRLARSVVRLFYWCRATLFNHAPLLARLFTNIVHRSGEELIESWRGAYARRAFYVPASMNRWELKRGVTDDDLARLRDWRRKLFNALALSLGLLAVGCSALVIALLAWLAAKLFGPDAHLCWSCISSWSGIVGAIGVALGFVAMEAWLPSVFKARPRFDEETRVPVAQGALGSVNKV